MPKPLETPIVINPRPDPAMIGAGDLMLPNVVEVVKHLARMAAERDYQAFLRGVESRQDAVRELEDCHG